MKSLGLPNDTSGIDGDLTSDSLPNHSFNCTTLAKRLHEPIPDRAPVVTSDDCTTYGMVLQSECIDRATLTEDGDQTLHVYNIINEMAFHAHFQHGPLDVVACMADPQYQSIEVDDSRDISNRSVAFADILEFHECHCGFYCTSSKLGEGRTGLKLIPVDFQEKAFKHAKLLTSKIDSLSRPRGRGWVYATDFGPFFRVYGFDLAHRVRLKSAICLCYAEAKALVLRWDLEGGRDAAYYKQQ